VRVKSGFSKVAWGLLIAMACLAVVGGEGAIAASAVALESQPLVAQALAAPSTDPEKPEGHTAVARGMRKEAVRNVWGDPEDIRQIRTCFGTQEEWVYRGDPKRFGAGERVLLFDEGEVLTEIK
jgi:hypothetical protein